VTIVAPAFGEAPRIVLVDVDGRRSMRVTSVDAHNWQSDAAEFVPKPAGHRASFKSDPFSMRSSLADQFRQRARRGLRLSLEYQAPLFIDNVNSS
jgi:hypothetical protein